MDKFLFPTNFIILDYEGHWEVPIILGRPFLSTGHALIDVHQRELTMHLNNEEIKCNIADLMKLFVDVENCSAIESFGWDYCEEEAYFEMFSTEEFLDEDELEYILKGVSIVSGEKKFEPLDFQRGEEDKVID